MIFWKSHAIMDRVLVISPMSHKDERNVKRASEQGLPFQVDHGLTGISFIDVNNIGEG